MKNLLFIYALVVLVSCSNNKYDYAYNEKSTSMFYSTKERVEELFQEFENGKFDEKQKGHWDFNGKNISTFIKNQEESLLFLRDELTHSEKANDFHQSILYYYKIVIDDFGKSLQLYYSETDDTKKSELKNKVYKAFNEIEKQQEIMLDKQIKFLDDAGIKIGTENN